MLNDNFTYAFSNEAQNEIYDFIKEQHQYDHIQDAKILASDDCPTFLKEVEEIRNELENGKRIVLVRPFVDLHNKYTIQEQRTISWLLGNVLGEPLVQNEAGDKVICVFDRDRNNTMTKGAFSDEIDAVTIFDFKKDNNRPLKRTMDRLWTMKREDLCLV